MAQMFVTTETALRLLKRQIERIDGLRISYADSTKHEKWRGETIRTIAVIFWGTQHANMFSAIAYRPPATTSNPEITARAYHNGLDMAQAMLQDLMKEVEGTDKKDAPTEQKIDQQTKKLAKETELLTLRAEVKRLTKELADYETKLHKQLSSTFNRSELKALCFSLNIDYENLSGENKDDKARELILHCRRYNHTAELLERCRELRPALLW